MTKHRLLVATCLLALAMNSCGTPGGDSGANKAAFDYLMAVDRGDKATQCELLDRGGKTVDDCIRTAQDAVAAFRREPETVAQYNWPDVENGQAVLLRVFLKANPEEPQITVSGMRYIETSRKWVVVKRAWTARNSTREADALGALR